LLNFNNNKSKQLYNQLIEQTVKVNADNQALEHRNKLLEYDRTRYGSVLLKVLLITLFNYLINY